MHAPAHIAWLVAIALYCTGLFAAETDSNPLLPRMTADELDAEPNPFDQVDASAESKDALMKDADALFWAGDYSSAEKIFRSLAESGYPTAQFQLGMMYSIGKGVPKNDREAARWFRLASDQGEPLAHGVLGRMYALGEGVPQNREEAARLYGLYAKENPSLLHQAALGFYEGNDLVMAEKLLRLAADLGHAPAQYNLAVLYTQNKEVKRNLNKAIRWYRQAAEQGYGAAQYNLGFMYDNGEGVPQDYREAFRWYKLAADQGQASAQNNLGYMYSQGHGVLQDYVQAHMWYNLAAAQGDSIAVKNRDNLARKMMPAQLAEAQRLAREWVPSGWEVVSEAPAQTEEPRLVGSGTGFVISAQGHVLTNNHVVEGCRELHVGTKADGIQRAELVSTNKRDDLAILRLPKQAAQSNHARFRILPPVRQGENSAVYGYPLSGALASGGNLTTGNVTALAGLDDDSRFFQTSAPVQPGNSGGPLLDMSGAVIGIVVSKLDALKVASVLQDIPQNVNFAIKSSIALNLLDSQGIPYEAAQAAATRSAADIADMARQFTLQVLCYQ